jgi:hypothetical protein
VAGQDTVLIDDFALLELLAMIWAEKALRHNRSSRPDLNRPARRAELRDRLDPTP